MASEGYTFHEDKLPEWGIEHIWLAQDIEGDVFFPVRTICEALGVERSTQAGIIKNDSRLKPGSRDIKLPPHPHKRGGSQEALCIRKHELAIWLALIDPDRVGERARAIGRLQEFQAALWRLADRMLFHGKAGADASAVPVPATTLLEGVQRAPAHCPDCGAPLLIEVEHGEARVSRR